MNVLAYIIYVFVMFIVGFILPSANVGLNTWQYWVVIACYIVTFICGTFYK